MDYRVTLVNGQSVNESIDTFYFRDANEALLELSVTVKFDRPNNKKIRDLRVVFPSEAFGAMGRNAWRLKSGSGDDLNVVLSHGESHTFRFRRKQNGVANFNLPFLVASKEVPFSEWRLPPAGTDRNRILSRQIKVVGVMGEEDRVWKRGQNDFAGVANYLRRYPKGKYQTEAGRRFNKWLDEDYNKMVLSNAAGTHWAEVFIKEYTPFADFIAVEDRLAEARQVLAGARAKTQPSVATNTAPARSKRRPKRIIRAPTAPVNQDQANGRVGYQILEENNGQLVIKLYNFKKPAYYDIYDGVLDIDASALQSDDILKIRQLKQGSVNLLIVERGREGRYVNIALNNTMEVLMAFDPILEEYTFNIEGGIEPYQLYLRPLDDQVYDWGMEMIEGNTVSVPLYDLQRAGLEGSYLAQVTSDGSARPFTLSKVILEVPKPTGSRTWIYPLMIAFGIGLFALLLLALLNRLGNRRPRGRKQQARI